MSSNCLYCCSEILPGREDKPNKKFCSQTCSKDYNCNDKKPKGFFDVKVCKLHNIYYIAKCWICEIDLT